MKRAALLFLTLAIGAGRAHAQEIEPTVDRFVRAWSRGDADAVAALAAHDGLVVELHGDAVGPLGGRQAAALLKRVLDDRETLSVRREAAQGVAGEPPRAFTEISWRSRMKGTSIPETFRVFLALVREDGGWRVTQIRILR